MKLVHQNVTLDELKIFESSDAAMTREEWLALNQRLDPSEADDTDTAGPSPSAPSSHPLFSQLTADLFLQALIHGSATGHLTPRCFLRNLCVLLQLTSTPPPPLERTNLLYRFYGGGAEGLSGVDLVPRLNLLFHRLESLGRQPTPDPTPDIKSLFSQDGTFYCPGVMAFHELMDSVPALKDAFGLLPLIRDAVRQEFAMFVPQEDPLPPAGVGPPCLFESPPSMEDLHRQLQGYSSQEVINMLRLLPPDAYQPIMQYLQQRGDPFPATAIPPPLATAPPLSYSHVPAPVPLPYAHPPFPQPPPADWHWMQEADKSADTGTTPMDTDVAPKGELADEGLPDQPTRPPGPRKRSSTIVNHTATAMRERHPRVLSDALQPISEDPTTSKTGCTLKGNDPSCNCRSCVRIRRNRASARESQRRKREALHRIGPLEEELRVKRRHLRQYKEATARLKGALESYRVGVDRLRADQAFRATGLHLDHPPDLGDVLHLASSLPDVDSGDEAADRDDPSPSADDRSRSPQLTEIKAEKEQQPRQQPRQQPVPLLPMRLAVAGTALQLVNAAVGSQGEGGERGGADKT
ncbi:unnamed protein product [Vitrella brassicaformis CCMP3155]|uniref:BZIP domain-containing protein n=2 Tax=Vitrella brassicaformis TaxID=1169539 RepID=A0A0G4EIG5_VITBC|nr:unnamed protein product [Vitrella brassicaformis CCMP3155]|eukprot:CEL96242.1 unnamed protein product [Vitrella brassicaformis CCMP3155]